MRCFCSFGTLYGVGPKRWSYNRTFGVWLIYGIRHFSYLHYTALRSALCSRGLSLSIELTDRPSHENNNQQDHHNGNINQVFYDRLMLFADDHNADVMIYSDLNKEGIKIN
jgi:hypothetical protein